MAKSVIAIDVREACRQKKEGKAQWTYGLVSELIRRSVPLLLLTDMEVPSEWAACDCKVFPSAGFRWHWQTARFLRKSSEIAVFVSPTSYIVPALIGRKFPCFPVVHDLIAFRPEPHDRKARWIERLTLGRAVRFAKKILTISGSTKQDLVKRFPHFDQSKIVTVYAGPMKSSVPRNEPDMRTILCIATLCPRKNQARLIQSYARLPADLRLQFRLVLAGNSGWQDEEIFRLIKETSGVEWKNYVSDEEYESLLHHCTVFALPSLYEGFGMQILDALQRGIPILTSDRGSLKEVTEHAALLVDPESVERIAEGLEKILREENLRMKLRAKGPEIAEKYSWKRTADLVLDAIS